MPLESDFVYSLTANASGYFSYRLDNGSDLGAIFVMADSGSMIELLADFPAKKREADGSTTYFIQVTNTSSIATKFRLQGGGVI